MTSSVIPYMIARYLTLIETSGPALNAVELLVIYIQPSLQTEFKFATVSHPITSWCSIGVVPNVLSQREEDDPKPYAVDWASGILAPTWTWTRDLQVHSPE